MALARRDVLPVQAAYRRENISAALGLAAACRNASCRAALMLLRYSADQ